ncbi:hypothetical protein DYY67_1251 [Candidatus Nitrosotalea sp. TS]|nr:hypothetical protein [Candidatus Nitrosotalea sp. TS]
MLRLAWHLQCLVQRVVTSEEAESLIGESWRFVGILPNGKVVLENCR